MKNSCTELVLSEVPIVDEEIRVLNQRKKAMTRSNHFPINKNLTDLEKSKKAGTTIARNTNSGQQLLLTEAKACIYFQIWFTKNISKLRALGVVVKCHSPWNVIAPESGLSPARLQLYLPVNELPASFLFVCK